MKTHDESVDARLRAAFQATPERFEMPTPELRSRIMAGIEALPKERGSPVRWGGLLALAACLLLVGMVVVVMRPSRPTGSVSTGLGVVAVLSREIEAQAAQAPAQLRTRVSEMVVEPLRDEVRAVHERARTVATRTERALRVMGALVRIGEQSSG